MGIQDQIAVLPDTPGFRHHTASSGRLACVPWRRLEQDLEAWDALALNASEPNPFFESWYLLPSLRHLSPGHEVMILRLDLDGQLAGILPIVRASRYYRWPIPNISSWVHDNAFCGLPLVWHGAETVFWQAILDWADGHVGTGLFLHLQGLTGPGPLRAALDTVLEQTGRHAETVHFEERAMLASDLASETYWEASLATKKRKELRRQANRLSDLGELRFHRTEGIADIDQWCADFLKLEQSGWKGRAGSALACDKGTAALFRQSLPGAARRGRLERAALTLDGRPIAMLATFLAPPGAFSYKTAFDEVYARYSPGVLLQRENLCRPEQPGVGWRDSCASADHPMIDHIWRERRQVSRLSIAIGGRVRRAAFRQIVRRETARQSAGNRP
ncbi:GNAT family N-acetyltransferase [Novosphingobium album (ex Hu et al. 2023)]|uniref:GNAT family N-acetyltransferase n=1 Tax=Novosphingobium album (ex Hu et al. 2023) TaxID=2930093 RepID=A0ABT0B431_9SPHN|nr:GNAT family N-acetyltransferase [Novosphingobium album (ex Hu et al. 2023)]MCJ2179579.1 GNAT family N-acetyltransferase [Novosphingobium album (ex Hu et al. 2023)]